MSDGPKDVMTNTGALIRRLHQITMAIFLEETAGFDITPAQYAALSIIRADPGMDQTQLMARSALDRSTITSCVERLETRGLIERQIDKQDRRVRRLRITDPGSALIDAVEEHVQRTQRRVVAPLGDRASDFVSMLRILVDGNNSSSRVPVRSE